MRAVFLCLALAACGASPSPAFFGAERSEITHDGRRYVVFHTAGKVEVVRLGYATAEERPAIREAMPRVISRTTGCSVRTASLRGDSGVMRGALDCG